MSPCGDKVAFIKETGQKPSENEKVGFIEGAAVQSECASMRLFGRLPPPLRAVEDHRRAVLSAPAPGVAVPGPATVAA